MKRRIAGAVACGVILIAVGVVTGASRATRRYDFQISGPLPTGVQVVPVSVASRKPLINWRIFGNEIVYPKPDIIFGFDDPGRTTSGFLSSLVQPYESFCDGTWTDEAGMVHRTTGDWLEGVVKYGFLPVPVAYGDKPRSLELRRDDEDPDSVKPIRVVLPASNLPIPKLKSVIATAGPLTLHMDPLPPIAAGFRVTYKVWFEGGDPQADYRITFEGSSDRTEHVIRIRPGQRGFVSLSASKGDRFQVGWAKLQARTLTLVARRVFWSTRGIYQIDFIDKGGQRVAYADEESGTKGLTRFSLISGSGFHTLKIGDAWFEERLDSSGEPAFFRDYIVNSMQAVKDGQKFEATAWTVLSRESAEVKIPIPDLTYRVP